MESSNRGRSLRAWSGALLTLLAWAVVAPEAALAGCSSHLLPTIAPSNEPGTGLDTLDRAGDLAVADVTEIPGRPKPCTGEMCSGRPGLPLSPAPPEIRVFGSWAIVAVITRIEAPERSDLRLVERTIRPSRCCSLIFHPPRP